MGDLVICTGGTAGHLYPAQQLAKEVGGDPLFVGAGLASSPFFDRSRYSFVEVEAAPKNLLCLGRGVWQSIRLLRRVRPSLVVGFGSYHSLPPLLAARFLGIPYLLYAADSLPGKVVRLLSKGAVATAIHFPAARDHLRGETALVSMPLRCPPKPIDRAMVLREWGLFEERKTLLIFGGSQGARRINELVLEAAASWRGRPIQIVQMTGDVQMSKRLRKCFSSLDLPARVVEFEPQMELAWGCADLLLSRAGASTLAEQMAWGVPGLLVPYPHAAYHQLHNARYLESEAGVLVLEQEGLTGQEVASTIGAILDGLSNARERMERCLPGKRRSLADLVRQIMERMGG